VEFGVAGEFLPIEATQKPCVLTLNGWHYLNELFTIKQFMCTQQCVEMHLTI